MKTMMRSRAATALLAAIGLTACENVDLGGGLMGQLLNRNQPTEASGTNVAAFLAKAPGSVALVSFEETGETDVAAVVARENGYATFVTPAGTSFTAKNGILAATRGYGNDIMSSDIDATLKLVSAKRTGTVSREMRYLNGAGETVAISFSCRVQLGDLAPIQSGEINTTARIVVESCTGNEFEFDNTYMVDNSGTVLSSRQWLNPVTGKIIFQLLRR